MTVGMSRWEKKEKKKYKGKYKAAIPQESPCMLKAQTVGWSGGLL